LIDRLLNFFKRDSFKKYIGQSSWLYSGMAVAAVARLANLALLTRFLSLGEYGQLALIISYGTTINALIDFRVWETIIKFFNEHFNAERMGKAMAVLRMCFAIDLGTGVVSAIVMTLTARLVARLLLHDEGLAGDVILYGLMMLFITTETTVTGVLRVYERFDLLGVKDIVVSFLRLIATSGAAYYFRSLHMVVVGYVVAGLLGALIFNFVAYRHTRKKVGPISAYTPLTKDERSQVFQFIMGTNVLGILKSASEQLDMLLVGFFGGPDVTAIYKVAVSTVNLHGMLKEPITKIAYPEIVRSRQKGRRALRGTIFAMMLISGLITVPSALGIAVFAEPIVKLISGSDVYLTAAVYIRIMLLGTLATGLFFWTGFLLMANERVWVINKIHLARTVILIPLMALLIPATGALGASWTHTLALAIPPLAALVVALKEGYVPIRVPRDEPIQQGVGGTT
jgi:O-antigen/teichoic acid export membrane protein